MTATKMCENQIAMIVYAVSESTLLSQLLRIDTHTLKILKRFTLRKKSSTLGQCQISSLNTRYVLLEEMLREHNNRWQSAAYIFDTKTGRRHPVEGIQTQVLNRNHIVFTVQRPGVTAERRIAFIPATSTLSEILDQIVANEQVAAAMETNHSNKRAPTDDSGSDAKKAKNNDKQQPTSPEQ